MKQKFDPEIWLVQRKEFNPLNWLPKQTCNLPPQAIKYNFQQRNMFDEVEVIVSRIEDATIDLTCEYLDWVKLGFAFASEFGESGRNYFNRVSRFYSGYDYTNCNLQFDKCLKSGKRKITIKTFFGMAKDAGIDIRVKNT